jgi:mycoredoxin
MGDGPGFARARTGKDADRAADRLRCLPLFRIEAGQDIGGHRNILAGKDVEGRMSLPHVHGTEPHVPPAGQLTIYSTPWCGYCVRLKRALEREGIEFVEIDIDLDPAAAEFVIGVNDGHATVPTLVLPDGTTLTNPPLPVLLSVIRAA